VRIRSLQVRIAIAFALLLVLVQTAGLAFINTILTQDTNREIEQKLAVGQAVFNLLHEENSRQLAQSATILSADFAFREAAATNDRDKVIAALVNQGARINADVTMLASLENVMIADTLHPNDTGRAFPFVNLAAIAREKGAATGVALIEGKAYDLVVVPVYAPESIAWLAMGFVIDDKFAWRLRSLTSLDVSFWNAGAGTADWTLLATTMSPEKRPGLVEAISRGGHPLAGNATLRVGDDNYVTAFSAPGTQGRNVVVITLQKSLAEELAPLRKLQTILIGLGLMSLLATVIASAWIARSMTRPLSALSRAAQKIEQGDYSHPIEIDQIDEIGRLASAINHMRDGIAAREAKIGDMANRDVLTGLPNRGLFHDRLEQAIKVSLRGGDTPTILLMDLDGFKHVNDSLGHHVGDLLLQEIAKRCVAALLRESDTVARLGGDEFAVLLPNGDLQGAQLIARKILSAVEQPMTLEGQQVIVGGSIGIASCPQHGEEIHTLLRHADMAMYAAKRSSSGYALYDTRYDRQSRQRLSLMSELRHAVECDELLLHYQPKIDLATGAVTQVEALVRWLHPERGFIPPDQFIPFAEHTGYIKSITQWVITKVLLQLADWRALGLTLNVSVNISARDLLNPELLAMFNALADQHNTWLQWLSLEVTESAIMADAAHAQAMLQFFRDIGLRLSIDDFGTGYSSLSYLKKLPVDELKIDKSFVINMATDKDDATIVRSTIDLGHNMGLKVVAEGVENEAAWQMLKAWGCDFAQGYYVSAALPPAELVQWLRQMQPLHAVATV
jgi:diguanylate cyclase (GGDEF)-like protein